MTSAEINLDDERTRKFAGEFLDARLAGILGTDWTPGEYIARRLRDEERKLIGGLSAGDDDDELEQDT